MTKDEIKAHMDILIEEKDRAIKSCKIDEISRANVIKAIASADTTDGTEKMFSGKEVIKLIKALPSVQTQSCIESLLLELQATADQTKEHMEASKQEIIPSWSDIDYKRGCIDTYKYVINKLKEIIK